MLDVAKKMCGYSSGAGLCDGGAAAELRERRLWDYATSPDVDANNPDSGTDLFANPGSFWCRMPATNPGQHQGQQSARARRTGGIQLKRSIEFPRHHHDRELVLEQFRNNLRWKRNFLGWTGRGMRLRHGGFGFAGEPTTAGHGNQAEGHARTYALPAMPWVVRPERRARWWTPGVRD